jgi:trk system potassium uptake protein TrkA
MRQTTIGVLGLGLFGTSIARTLADNNVDVIAMDKNMNHIEEVVDEVDLAVQGDFTRIDQLQEAGFGECDEVVIAASERLEDSILAILHLINLGVEKITVKTKNVQYREVLFKVGATRVILPEVEMGAQVATTLANPTVHELIQLDSRYNITEFPYRDAWVGKNIVEMDFRNKYDTNIIAVQPANSSDFTIEFGPQYTITEGDIFIGVTTDEGMKKLLNS